MERADVVQRYKRKYMAQVLENFEHNIEPHLPREAAGAVQDFKGLVRARMNALATDAVEILTLDTVPNGVAQEIRAALSPTGRP